MAFQYGQYDPSDPDDNYTGSVASDTITATGPFQDIAVGSFTGDANLPGDGTTITSEADFNSYVSALENKTSEVETDDTLINWNGTFGHAIALGGSGNDTIDGSRAVSSVTFFMGRDGNDSLVGVSGSDKLEGDAGNDTLVSAGDGDTLNGGLNADTFTFTALTDRKAATIVNLNGDTIDLSAVDADVNTTGDQAFKLVSYFDGHAGEILLKHESGSDRTTILLDTDGDGHANAKITVVHGNDFSHFVY